MDNPVYKSKCNQFVIRRVNALFELYLKDRKWGSFKTVREAKDHAEESEECHV